MSDGTTNQFRCDAAARIATSTQTTDGVSYPFTYAYYMDGNVASVQYPSGRTVSYPSVDRAGRVTQVTGTLGGASKSYVSAMTYNEQGLMAATALGNGLTERWSYNAQRLQPSDVRLGTAVNRNSVPVQVTLKISAYANPPGAEPVASLIYFIKDFQPGASHAIDAPGILFPCASISPTL